MAPTKEDLNKLKFAELQTELESRGLDTSGKKFDLVDRLFDALSSETSSTAQVSSKLTPAEPVSGDETPDAALLLARLRILKDKQVVEQERISVRARAEQDETRLQARSEQLQIELQLAELGQYDEAVIEPLRVSASGRATESESAPESALSTQVRRALLPPTELRPFSGDIEDYRLFMSAFEARIASKTEDPGELLFYLEQFTRGKPNQLVRSGLHLREAGFGEAKRLLETRYGNPVCLVDSYVEKVKAWSRIPPGDVEALDRFALFLTEVRNAMSGVTLSDFEHPSTLRLIVSKVPPYLQDRWLREADRLGQDRRTARFSDLVEFLAAEVRVKKNPFFGFRSVDANCRPDTSSASRRHTVNAAHVTASSVQRCLFCGDPHSVADCQVLRLRPWAERHKVLMQHRLCFACVRRGHQARSCRRPQVCGVCGGLHPSVLHGGPAQSLFSDSLVGQRRERRQFPPRDAPQGMPPGHVVSSGEVGTAVVPVRGGRAAVESPLVPQWRHLSVQWWRHLRAQRHLCRMAGPAAGP